MIGHPDGRPSCVSRNDPIVADMTSTTGLDVAGIVAAGRYGYRDEHDLQAGLAEALTAAGRPVEREVRLGPRDRLDLLTGRTGIEVKVAGTADRVLAQLTRYAASDLVDDLILVTTRVRHRTLPDTVGGKPLRVVQVGGIR